MTEKDHKQSTKTASRWDTFIPIFAVVSIIAALFAVVLKLMMDSPG